MFLPYAETHFKFRLPWSPLHKRWPEIFLDAPFQVLPGKPFSVYLLVKDADLYPVVIQSLELEVTDEHGEVTSERFDLDLRCDRNLIHKSFPLLPGNLRDGFRGKLRVSGSITAENKQGKSIRFLCHNFPGIEQRPL